MQCPFCWATIADLDRLPVVATNYVSAGDGLAAPSGQPIDVHDDLENDLGGIEPDGPLVDSRDAPPVGQLDGGETRTLNRPVSGAPTVGQIGPYPVLLDPERPGVRRSFFERGDDFATADMAARACRNCCMALPDDFGKHRVVTIGVVGNQYAGKSHYLTALCFEIMRRQRLEQLGFGAVEPILETGDEFYQKRFRPLYLGKTAHGRTTTDEGLEAARRPLALNLEGGDGPSRTLMFHDVPGEWLSDQKRRRRHFEFLNHLDGLILIIDPMAVPAVRHRLSDSVESDHFHDDLTPQDLLISSLARQIGEAAAARLPVSAVIAKSDMVVRAFGPISALDRPEAGSADQMWDDIKTLHRVVVDEVQPRLDEPSLVSAVNKFPMAVWHLVAPIGTLPDTQLRINGEIKSSRVVDPLFRVLAELGAPQR